MTAGEGMWIAFGAVRRMGVYFPRLGRPTKMPQENTKRQPDPVKPYVPPASLNPGPFSKQHDVCLEQYKAYLGDLGNIGTRYATVQGFYVSVIVALISVLALAESNKILSQLQTGTLVVVCLFAVALCIVWALTIRFYQRVFRAKVRVLTA